MKKLVFEHLDQDDCEDTVAHAIMNDYANHAEFDEGCLDEGRTLTKYEVVVIVKEKGPF